MERLKADSPLMLKLLFQFSTLSKDRKFLSTVRYVHVHDADSEDRQQYQVWMIAEDGQVFACGYNQTGTLGIDRAKKSTQRPVPITELKGVKIAQFYHSNSATFALTEDGKVWSWGTKAEMDLGHRNRNGKPAMISFPRESGSTNEIRIIKLCLAPSAVLALDSDGTLYTWGFAQWIKYDLPSPLTPTSLRCSLPMFDEPRTFRPEELPPIKIVDIAVSTWGVVFLLEDGRLFGLRSTWRNKSKDTNSTSGFYSALFEIKLQPNQLIPASRIEAGAHFIVAMARDGDIYCWGQVAKRRIQAPWQRIRSKMYGDTKHSDSDSDEEPSPPSHVVQLRTTRNLDLEPKKMPLNLDSPVVNMMISGKYRREALAVKDSQGEVHVIRWGKDNLKVTTSSSSNEWEALDDVTSFPPQVGCTLEVAHPLGEPLFSSAKRKGPSQLVHLDEILDDYYNNNPQAKRRSTSSSSSN